MDRQRGMKQPGGKPNDAAGTESKIPVNKTSKKNQGHKGKRGKQSIPAVLRRIKPTKDQITYVLDTNVIMTAWDSLFKFEEHNVYIVGQVLAELDAHKKGSSPEAWNVRRAIREIDNLIAGKTNEELEAGIVLTPPVEILNGKPHTGKLFFDFTQPVISKDANICLDVNHPDDRIILICLSLQAAGKHVVLVSNDGSCRIKARVVGIEAEEYLSDTVGIIQGEENISPGFHTMPANFWEEAQVDCSVTDGVTQYKLKHDTLQAVACNEFLVMEDGNHLRVISTDGTNGVMAEPFKYRDELREMHIAPKNREQMMALQLLLDPDLPSVSLAGPAGSGKSFLTIAAAMHQKDRGIYDEIIFTRSAQDADENPGFLTGNLLEKMSPWMGALWDNIKNLLKLNKKIGSGKEGTEDELQKIGNTISVESLNVMKGRSLEHTFMIIDETQDLKPKTLKMISTRIGEGSKIVFLGNVAQIDNPHLTEFTCGLSKFIRLFRHESLAGHVTLQRGERSAFATRAEELL